MDSAKTPKTSMRKTRREMGHKFISRTTAANAVREPSAAAAFAPTIDVEVRPDIASDFEHARSTVAAENLSTTPVVRETVTVLPAQGPLVG